jgi:hypothetical protein
MLKYDFFFFVLMHSILKSGTDESASSKLQCFHYCYVGLLGLLTVM